MKKTFLTTAFILSTATAHAGGVIEPIAPLTPMPAVATFDWTGPYAGLSLGYANGSFGNGTVFPGDGEGDLSGGAIGLTLGYNYQINRAVVGAELAYNLSNIDGSESCVNPAFACSSEIDRYASLSLTAGYLATPSTLIYGKLGYAYADAFVSTDNGTELGTDEGLDGVVYGLGVERAFGNGFHLRGEIARYEFSGEDFQTDILYQDVDHDFTTVSISLIRQF